MPARHIVAVGASTGGVEALRTILQDLSAPLPVPILVVIHTSPESPGILEEIRDRAGTLPVSNARDGEAIRDGHVYVAPPDRHLLVEPGVLRLTHGPRENRFRPAIDPMLLSVARVYGPGAIGVILTGNLDDGTAGLRAIKQLGGTAIVQDPADAQSPSMPQSALLHVPVDYSVPLADIAGLLERIASTPVNERLAGGVPERIDVELAIAKEGNPLEAGLRRIGRPSLFSCPECHGVLLRVDDSGPPRFRCHTGHAYTADSLLTSLDETIDEAIWGAVRAVEEGVLLARHLAEHAERRHDDELAARLTAQAIRLRQQLESLRARVMPRDPVGVDTD